MTYGFRVVEMENGLGRQTMVFQAWGLAITSCMDLPEFLPGCAESPDVVVSYGTVPDTLDDVRVRGVRFQAGPGRFLLMVDGIARYLVAGGREIRIQKEAEAEDDAVRLFLRGSAFGALLHQRGALPLHAAAIRANGRAVLFCGVSGVGKSALAGAFFKRGYPVLADDICALSPDGENGPMVLPSFPRITLWADATRKLGEDPAHLPKVRRDLEKYGLPLEGGFCSEPTPLDRIYLLNTTNTDRFEMASVRGMEKLDALVKNTYRFRFLNGPGGKAEHFNHCSAAGRRAVIRRITRPQKGFRIDELADLIERDFSA